VELKIGYKQTDMGLIPDDWEIARIGDYSHVTKLAGFEYTIHFDYSKSGPVIAIRALNIKDGGLDLSDIHTIPRETSEKLPRSQLRKGDLVISYVGTLGRVAVISEDNKFHLAPNVA
jgi:type I restriction enzyme S subunit